MATEKMKKMIVPLGLWIFGEFHSSTILGVPVAPDEETRLLVLLSLPMCENLLLRLQRESIQYNAMLVLRELVNDSVGETLHALMISAHTEADLQLFLDPMDHQRYDVVQMPAVVLAKGDKFDVARGDRGIQTALETISQRSELAGEAQAWLNKYDKRE